MKKKLFNGEVSFEFLRRSMAMMSYTLLMISTLAFTAFRVETKMTTESWVYSMLVISCVVALFVAAAAICHDCFRRYRDVHVANFIINLAGCVFFMVFLSLILIYGLHNAARLYSAIYS